MTLTFDLGIQPMTLTYNNNLAKVKVDPHAKIQGHWSNGSAVIMSIDERTDDTKCIISLLS